MANRSERDPGLDILNFDNEDFSYAPEAPAPKPATASKAKREEAPKPAAEPLAMDYEALLGDVITSDGDTYNLPPIPNEYLKKDKPSYNQETDQEVGFVEQVADRMVDEVNLVLRRSERTGRRELHLTTESDAAFSGAIGWIADAARDAALAQELEERQRRAKGPLAIARSAMTATGAAEPAVFEDLYRDKSDDVDEDLGDEGEETAESTYSTPDKRMRRRYDRTMKKIGYTALASLIVVGGIGGFMIGEDVAKSAALSVQCNVHKTPYVGKLMLPSDAACKVLEKDNG